MSEVHEQLSRGLRHLAAARLGAATLVEIFSDKGGMELSLMQEPDGQQFVARTFDERAEAKFKRGFNRPFWLDLELGVRAMTAMYAEVGLEVVKSSVLPAEEGKPRTVISEYIPDLLYYDQASLEAKKQAVTGMARLLDPKNPYLPSGDALVGDLFMYKTDEDGAQRPIIVDNEPYLMLKNPDGNAVSIDDIRGSYINLIASYIDGRWSNGDDEKAALARAFFGGLSTIDDMSVHNGHATIDATMKMHALTQPVFLEARREQLGF